MTPALLMRQVETSGGWTMGGITSDEYEMGIARLVERALDTAALCR